MERDYVRLDYWTSDRSLVVDFVFWDLGIHNGFRIANRASAQVS